MPCTVTGSLEGDRALASSERNQELSSALQKTTRVACELSEALRGIDSNYTFRLSQETQDWIDAHEKLDRARIAQAKAKKKKQKLKNSALAKLSLEERKALGLENIQL